MTSPRPRLLLVHGIWMPRFTLQIWRRALAADGAEVHLVPYSSARESVAVAVGRLRGLLLDDRQATAVVGHSLGGLLSLLALRDQGLRTPVACLGSPLAGSHVARSLARSRWSRPVLGTARDLLCQGLGELPQGPRVLSLAGDLPTGFGALFPGLARPHDGTVAVAETLLPGLAATARVRASHSGLLASRRAMAEVRTFLAQNPPP